MRTIPPIVILAMMALLSATGQLATYIFHILQAKGII